MVLTHFPSATTFLAGIVIAVILVWFASYLLKRFNSRKLPEKNMELQVVPQQNIEGPTFGRRTIYYAILLGSQKVGEAKVEYCLDLQHAIIHNFDVEPDFQRQGIGSFAVGWLIANTPYLIDTGYEWNSAYGFWSKMRDRFKGRMLPPRTTFP